MSFSNLFIFCSSRICQFSFMRLYVLVLLIIGLLHCIVVPAYIIACMSCSVMSSVIYSSEWELLIVSIIFCVSFLYISFGRIFLFVGSLPFQYGDMVSC